MSEGEAVFVGWNCMKNHMRLELGVDKTKRRKAERDHMWTPVHVCSRLCVKVRVGSKAIFEGDTRRQDSHNL
jgi:hypothetical protein